MYRQKKHRDITQNEKHKRKESHTGLKHVLSVSFSFGKILVADYPMSDNIVFFFCFFVINVLNLI